MAAEGMKKKPGVMKSTAGYMKLLNTYVERIATAKRRASSWSPTAPGSRSRSTRRWTWWASSTFWGDISDVVAVKSVPEALSISLSTGTPNKVCSFFRNMDGLMQLRSRPS